VEERHRQGSSVGLGDGDEPLDQVEDPENSTISVRHQDALGYPRCRR